MDGWILGPEGERLLWIPDGNLWHLPNPALKYTTMPMQLDLSKFVRGEHWTKCYSGDMDGKQQE